MGILRRFGELCLSVKTFLRVLYGKLSVFTACSLSCGGAAGLYGASLENWKLCFMMGSLVPLGPMTLWFSSTKRLDGDLKK